MSAQYFVRNFLVFQAVRNSPGIITSLHTYEGITCKILVGICDLEAVKCVKESLSTRIGFSGNSAVAVFKFYDIFTPSEELRYLLVRVLINFKSLCFETWQKE